MSLRAIAAVGDVSKDAVSRDLVAVRSESVESDADGAVSDQVSHSETPDGAVSDQVSHSETPDGGESQGDKAAPEPPEVTTGLDGKTHSRDRKPKAAPSVSVQFKRKSAGVLAAVETFAELGP